MFSQVALCPREWVGISDPISFPGVGYLWSHVPSGVGVSRRGGYPSGHGTSGVGMSRRWEPFWTWELREVGMSRGFVTRKNIHILLCELNTSTCIYAFSLLAHKEFRFLFPVLPMAMHVCGVFLHNVCDDGEDYEEEESTSLPKPPESSQQTQVCYCKSIIMRRYIRN